MIPFKNTPWGKPIIAQEIAPGVWVVATASHGGFYLNTDALARIPDAHQAYAARWSHGHGPNWFEEDAAIGKKIGSDIGNKFGNIISEFEFFPI